MASDRCIRTDTILLTAGLLLLCYLLGDVLLLIFAAVLLAVGLDGSTRFIAEQLPLSRTCVLVGVATAIAGIVTGLVALMATRLVQQFRELSETVVGMLEQVRAWLRDLGALNIVNEIGSEGVGVTGAASEMAEHVMTYGLTVFGIVSSLIILIVLTLFLAANPALYRRGMLHLVPPDWRGVVDETLSAIAHSLRWWFLGQFASMAILGVTVSLGLFSLGVDLWLALGVLTALLTFVPFLGPLIATVPVVAVGFTEGIQTGVMVLSGYILIQNIEGNVLVPMIQHKAVNLAPALLISVQLLLSLIFGVAGLILAAPLAIVVMVSVQKLWVEHTLGEKIT